MLPDLSHDCELPLSTLSFFFFFFNDTATTEIYTLSLHDALPISPGTPSCGPPDAAAPDCPLLRRSFVSITRQLWLDGVRSEEHTSELQSQSNLVCRLLLEKKKDNDNDRLTHDVDTEQKLIHHATC